VESTAEIAIDERLIEMAVDVVEQIKSSKHPQPVLLEIFSRLRKEATEALTGILDIDPNDAKAIAQLQSAARMYEGFVGVVRDIYSEGVENIDLNRSPEERALFEEMILKEPDPSPDGVPDE
jgi:hypothetical protein